MAETGINSAFVGDYLQLQVTTHVCAGSTQYKLQCPVYSVQHSEGTCHPVQQ